MIAGDANLRNVAGLKKKTEKLSTGYKINRAADNASGLSVSEKMRSQIRGLSQATSNANDAISLMQTAEGGLQETEDILQRMRELAVQSANGTYTDEDRAHLQDEVDALKGEIDRISESTEFNEMKLLSGEVSLSLETKVPTNDYGARYGSINYDLDIGGGKVSVASSIQGMWLKFTTGASGKGGENAFYEYDVDRTQGELTQHITINLAEGQTYTDEQIQKLIDNAKYPKEFETAPGKVLFKSEIGQIHAAEAETYNLIAGGTIQKFEGMYLKDLITSQPLDMVTYSDKSFNHTSSYNLIYDTNATERGISISLSNKTVTLNGSFDYSNNEVQQAMIEAGVFDNNNKDENGNYVKNDRLMDNISVYIHNGKVNFSYNEKYRSANVNTYNVPIFDISATQYGSYEEYLEDDPKYKQPDVEGAFNLNAIKNITFKANTDSSAEDIEVSSVGGVNSKGKQINEIVVALKKSVEIETNDIQNKIQTFLDNNNLKYTVNYRRSNYIVHPPNNQNGSNPITDTAVKDLLGVDHSVFVSYHNSTKIMVGSSELKFNPTETGSRFVERTGTVAGIRQTAEGDLTALMIRPGSGTVGSSDHIKFTANSYGKAVNYKETLVSEFRISTEQDLHAGGEYVDTSSGIAEIHLATGTKYTNESIEKLLKDAGLDYTVELTDSHNPDGDKDGEIIFNNTGSVRVPERVAGQGVGTDDVTDITDKLEFQIGANGVEDQKVGMDIIDASAKSIGVDDIDISTQNGANKAIEKIDKAVKQVSTFRSKMGALQNRMEKSVNSLNTANENLTDAESRIRDTDVASEMIEYQKNNILQQASQSMLAQANQQTNGVLSLLG